MPTLIRSLLVTLVLVSLAGSLSAQSRPELNEPYSEPGTPDDLAMGPFDAEVSWKKTGAPVPDRVEATVYILTRTECVFRVKKTNELVVAYDRSPRGTVTLIATPDNKWLWQFKDGAFQGKAKPPRPST